MRDRYGDHGFCGAYVHNSEGRRLEHFAFSCRILGLGVERWLYQKLGRPRIDVKGEVLADLFDPAPVDWVRSGRAEAGRRRPTRRASGASPRAAPARSAPSSIISSYNSDDAVGEYHIFRDGGVFRIGHSVFLYHGARGLTPARREAARKLGYVESDFSTRLYDPSAYDERGHLVILGFSADCAYPLYRHRELRPHRSLHRPCARLGRARRHRRYRNPRSRERYPAWAREAMRSMRSEWDFLGLTKPSDFEALLRFAVAEVPASAKIRLLAFFARDYVDADGASRRAPGALHGLQRGHAPGRGRFPPCRSRRGRRHSRRCRYPGPAAFPSAAACSRFIAASATASGADCHGRGAALEPAAMQSHRPRQRPPRRSRLRAGRRAAACWSSTAASPGSAARHRGFRARGRADRRLRRRRRRAGPHRHARLHRRAGRRASRDDRQRQRGGGGGRRDDAFRAARHQPAGRRSRRRRFHPAPRARRRQGAHPARARR